MTREKVQSIMRDIRLSEIANMEPWKRPSVFYTQLQQNSSGDYSLGNFEATKFTKSNGAQFSGWVVKHHFDNSRLSDPISTKTEALRVLRKWHQADLKPHDFFDEVC